MEAVEQFPGSPRLLCQFADDFATRVPEKGFIEGQDLGWYRLALVSRLARGDLRGQPLGDERRPVLLLECLDILVSGGKEPLVAARGQIERAEAADGRVK